MIRFKAEASAWTPTAVQLQQVWIDPPARRQGYAGRALRDLIRLLLATTPTVCLFVRARERAGDPALRVDRHAARARLPLASSCEDADPRAPRARASRTPATSSARPRPAEGSPSRAARRRVTLGRTLAPEAIDLGVSSRLLRTQETLDARARRAATSARLVEPLLDEIGFGSFEGGPLADVPQPGRGRTSPTTPCPGGGESRAEAALRFAGAARRPARPTARRRSSSSATRCPLRYVIDAADGRFPAARLEHVPHATPYRLERRCSRAWPPRRCEPGRRRPDSPIPRLVDEAVAAASMHTSMTLRRLSIPLAALVVALGLAGIGLRRLRGHDSGADEPLAGRAEELRPPTRRSSR